MTICGLNISCSVLISAICFQLFMGCTTHTKILFQDDFESAIVTKKPQKPWVISGNGSVVIDNSNSFSGENSAYFISGEGFVNRAFLSLTQIFPIKNNSFYGSMQMFVKKASPDGVHWTMLQGSGNVNNEYSAEIRYGGQHQQQLMANYDTVGVESDCWQHSSFKIPEKRWFKVCWYFNGQENTMKLWIDNQLISALTVKGKGEGCVKNGTQEQWIFPAFDKLSIGWVDYQKEGGRRHVWIDDVVIATQYPN